MHYESTSAYMMAIQETQGLSGQCIGLNDDQYQFEANLRIQNATTLVAQCVV